ncbi:unnamed protein product [Pneumocystis jirovecii]|uniref:Myb-like domain-containing protein n=1 Tax=Pneumocystis jirovecii TaxID=42068 RepID=L0PE60_PNEJI|nr:unnamed protein product [Pneumocystis jirovecii]
MWNTNTTQNSLENISNNKNFEETVHEQLQIQQKTLPEDQQKNWIETSTEELTNIKTPENTTENFTNEIAIAENDVISETTYESDRFFQEQFSLSPFKIDTETLIKEDNKVDNALETEHGNKDNYIDVGDFDDFDMIREMLPDLQHHALRLINFLIPIISSTVYTKEITATVIVSQYTHAHYINLSQFLNRLSEDEVHTLLFANAALLLSELYNPLSEPPTFEDLTQQYNSLYEINQQLPFIFNIAFSNLYLQIIELRTQLFIHAIWLNKISKDHEENFQFNENNELKKYFMNENDLFEISKEDKKAYNDACIERVEKIQHIRKFSTLEALIEAFPWHNFIKLTTKFIEKNILDLLNEPKANKLSPKNYKEEKTSIIPFNSQFSEDSKNDDKNLIYSLEQKEHIFNSENEGEISASDIKHLSQIVLDVQNDDVKHIENNNQDSKYIKNFFDKQKDYQKIMWELQNENSKSLKKRNSFQDTFNNPNISTQYESDYNKKKERHIKHSLLPSISTKAKNLKSVQNSKENLKTDAVFFTSSDMSSDSEFNSPLSSPPIIPSISAQIAMELYKKSLAIQGLSSTLIMNKNNVQSTDNTEEKKHRLIKNSYQNYSDLKQHFQLNKVRRKEYKHQHRVPWSEVETSCLMKAIEEHGSQWSFILSLYGPNGTLSRDLAERGQVQLKDKARSIKEEYIRAQWKLPPGFESITCKYD